MAEFHLLDCNGLIYWWEHVEGQYLDSAGTPIPRYYAECSKLVETATAETFYELDHRKTSLFKPDSDTGWLGRDGTFYGCSYADHDRLALRVIRKTVAELERTGWIRVHGPRAVLTCQRHPTDEQLKWAADHGHKFTPWQVGREAA